MNDPNLENEKELLNLRNVMMTYWTQISFEIYAKNIYHFLRHFGYAFNSSATGVTVKIKDDDWKFDDFMDQLFIEKYAKLFFKRENLSSYDAFYIVKHNLHRIQAFVYATNFGVRIHFCLHSPRESRVHCP